MTILYTTVTSPLGVILIAATKKGLCAVHIADDIEATIALLNKEFPNAALVKREDTDMQIYVQAVADYLSNKVHPNVPVHMHGTEFQQHIWSILMTIPRGETRTYAQIAELAGKPSAVRAVASACSKNKIALLVPCHRIVRKDGSPSGYRWGLERKQYLLESEKI